METLQNNLRSLISSFLMKVVDGDTIIFTKKKKIQQNNVSEKRKHNEKNKASTLKLKRYIRERNFIKDNILIETIN